MSRVLLVAALIILFACAESDDPKILFEQGNYEKAFELWLPLANNGDAEAENYLGIHYYLGLGKKKNHKSAKEWFEKAATIGFPDAQYNLGVMYQNGEYVKKDYITAYMWFYLANQSGNTHASRRMQTLADEHKLFPNQITHAIDMAKARQQNAPLVK